MCDRKIPLDGAREQYRTIDNGLSYNKLRS